MKSQEQKPNISNLESKKSAALLNEGELSAFRKLPHKEQKKQQEDRLKKLEELNNNFRIAIQEATKTGSVDEAKKLKVAFDKDAEELKQLIAETEIYNVKVMEIIPDKEITSAETAIEKLENEGYKISDQAKDMLAKVNWKEKLKDSYEIISIPVGELFGGADEIKIYHYAEIKAKAIEQGLELVPAKLAPSIRLNYEKNGGWTSIAMEAIRDSDNYPRQFDCYRDWLSGYYGGTGWASSYRFFFVRK